MEDRNQRIIRLFQDGHGINEIGLLFGITRQRAHQIIKNYSTRANKQTKKVIFVRDNFTCQWGEKCKPYKNQLGLIIHHIDKNSQNNNLKNLITLCKKCHVHFHKLSEYDNRKDYVCDGCQNRFKGDQSYSKKLCVKCLERRRSEAKIRMANKQCNICQKNIPFKRTNKCDTCISKERYRDPKKRMKIITANRKWQINHPEQNREIVKKAVKRYAASEKGKVARRVSKKRWLEDIKINNPERFKEIQRRGREAKRRFDLKKKQHLAKDLSTTVSLDSLSN